MVIFFKIFILILLICFVCSIRSTTNSTDIVSEKKSNGGKCKTDIDCGPKEECSWLFGTCSRIKCSQNTDCFNHEYCEKSGTYRKGWCKFKGLEGEWCRFDERCLSMHCHNLKCKGRQVAKNVEPNGRCEEAKDCRFEQYCNSKKCVDRIENGSCKNDDQCLSNHCSFSNKCDNTMLSFKNNTNTKPNNSPR